MNDDIKTVTLTIAASQNAYCVDNGIVRLGDTYKLKTYNPFGSFRMLRVSKPYQGTALRDDHHKVNFGVSTVPRVLFEPTRKWFIKADKYGLSEEERRNLFAEHQDYDEGVILVVDSDDMDEHRVEPLNNVDVRLKYLEETLSFYGVFTHTIITEKGGVILLDPNKPECFVKKMLPYNEKELKDHLFYWRYGGWFRTLKPINDKLIRSILTNGLLFEGYKGMPYGTTTEVDPEKPLELELVDIEIPRGYGIDLGQGYVYISE